MSNESFIQKQHAYSRKCKSMSSVRFLQITDILIFLVLMVFLNASTVAAADPLVASMQHNVFENTIDIEVSLQNAHFSTLFLPSTLLVSTNTNNVQDDRSISLDNKSVYVTLTIVESVQDLEISVKLPSCCVQTQEQLTLSADITFSFNAGTFLPNCPRLSLQAAISFIQDSVLFILLRMVPIHLIFFTHIQGILVLLLSDIYLPQKFYEAIRTYCSLVFQSINPWQLSKNFTPDIHPKTLFGTRLEVASTSLHISQIGFQENFFAQAIGPAMILCVLWAAWYFCRIKGHKLVQLQIMNYIAILHKTTLMLFSIFMFEQLRMLGYVWNDAVSVISVITSFGMIGYFIFLSYLIVRLAVRKNIPGEDQSIEERAFTKISSSMRCFFCLPSQYDNAIIQDQKQQQQQLLEINKNNLRSRGNRLVKWFPLMGIAFKLWVSFILVFLQGVTYFQMVMILISYGFYGVLTYRYFLGLSSYPLVLKVAQQVSFILLLIFCLVNHIIIENLLSSVPQSGGSVKLADDSYDSLSAIQIVQFLLLATYVILSILNKLLQFQAFFHSPKLRAYDSQERLILSKKQITQISNVVQEMMAQQKQTQMIEEPLPLAKMIVWKNQQITTQPDSKRSSQAIVTNVSKINNPYCNNDFNRDVVKQRAQTNLERNKNTSKNAENMNNNNSSTQKTSDKRQSKQLKLQQQENDQNVEKLSEDKSNNALDENLIENKYSTIGSQQSAADISNNQLIQIQQQYNSNNFSSVTRKDGGDMIIKYGSSSCPSVIPVVHKLVLRKENKDGGVNQSQFSSSAGINCNLNESDVDAFSSIQRVLNQRPYNSRSTSLRQLETLMKETDVKLVELTQEQHQNIVEFIKNQQTSKAKSSKLQYYPGDTSTNPNDKHGKDSFEKAKKPVSLLIRNETIRRFRNLYARQDDNEADFSNFIENIQEATVIEKKSPMKVSTKYSQRNFVISSNSFKRFDELVKLYANNSTATLSITTRIFFDLEPYYLNSQIQFSAHASFSFSFPKY